MLNKALGKALSVSFINQILTSGTNFAIVLYLVRAMEKSEFGVYSLGFAVMLVLAGLISSLIGVQYVVNLPDQHRSHRDDYAVHHANAVALLGLSLLVVAALVVMLPHDLSPWLSKIKTAVMSISFASASYSLREFLVRVAYSARREDYVLYGSVGTSVAIVVGFAVFNWSVDRIIIAADALIILSISYLFSATLLILMLRLKLAKSSLQGLKEAFFDCWRGGKWNVLATAMKRAQSQSYNIVVAPFLGMAAVADINAARVLVTPAVMMVPPLTQILLPRMAEERKNSGIVKIRWAIVVLVGMALLYSLFMLPMAPWLVSFALGESYEGVDRLVILWCVFSVFFSLKSALVLVLQAMRKFKELMWVGLLSFILTVALCLLLVRFDGGAGVVLAMVIAEILVSIYIVIRVRPAARLMI